MIPTIIAVSAAVIIGGVVINRIRKKQSHGTGNSNLKNKAKKSVQNIAKLPLQAVKKTDEALSQQADFLNSFIAGKTQDNNRTNSR